MMVLRLAAFLFLLVTVSGKPNILIMVADDLGYGDLGCYGNTSVETPNIDALARSGVKMTQHLTAASVCTPSRAALLTGRYPIRSGMVPIGVMRVNTWPMSTSGLPSSEVTFAELSRQAGYRNGYIGKWHLGLHASSYGDNQNHPLNQGFDHFYGLIGTNLEDFGEEGTKVVVNYRPHWYAELTVVWAVTLSTIYSLRVTGSIGKGSAVLSIILWSVGVFLVYFVMDNYTLLCSFLHRNYTLVEQPIRLAGLSQKLVKEGAEFIRNSTFTDEPFLLVMSWVHMHVFLRTAKEYQGRSKFGRYGDALQELDWSVGEIISCLKETGTLDNTIVYFTSDNGGQLELGSDGGFNGVLKGGKTHGAPDGGIRVPGIISWPGVLPTNTVTDEPTSLMDIFNMVSTVTGVPLPRDRQLDGKDIIPLLKGETIVSPHKFMFHYCGDRLHAVRYRPESGLKTWKYVTHEPLLNAGTNQCTFVCSCNNALRLTSPVIYMI